MKNDKIKGVNLSRGNTPMNDLITLTTVNDVTVVDSRLIAVELGIKHSSFIRTIKKYLTELKGFGHLGFEIETVTNSVGASNKVTFCYLNEDQATFVMTLSKNTDKVVRLKTRLVKSFSQAKKVIASQGDRIKELELELQLTKAQQHLLDTRNLICSTMPEVYQQRVLGYTEIKTVEYRDRVIKDDEVIRDGTTLNKTQLCRRYGFMTKSGKPNYKQLNSKLLQLNLPSEVWELKVALKENQEFKSEYLDDLDQALLNDDRQMWLGE